MNPFESNVDWQALATFLTGISAVAGALLVARRQNQLRRDEIRVALLQVRRDVLEKFDRVSGQWWAEAKLDHVGLQDFRKILRDIELVYDSDIYKRAEKIFKDTALQRAFASNLRAFIDSQQLEKYDITVEKDAELLEQLCERLPALRALLVSATQVGSIFK